MAKLSERDLALLSSLMYCDEAASTKYHNEKVSVLVDYLLKETEGNVLGKTKELRITGDFNGIRRAIGDEVGKALEKRIGKLGIRGVINYADIIARDAVAMAAKKVKAATGVKMGGDIVALIAIELKKGAGKKASEKAGIYFAAKAFRELLHEIKESPALRELTIVTSVIRPLDSKKDVSAVCFVDDANNATVAFRGTDNSYKEWYDDFEGAGIDLATPMQEAAKKFVEDLTALNPQYNNITVTGHSKGGNMAAYVTVLCANVTNCVSFDGQGFNEMFLARYALLVAANWKNIKTISSDKDKVNTFLISIGKKYYVKTDGAGFSSAHFMLYLIFGSDEKGHLDFNKEGDFFDKNKDYAHFVWQHPLTTVIRFVADGLVLRLPPFLKRDSRTPRALSLRGCLATNLWMKTMCGTSVKTPLSVFWSLCLHPSLQY